VKIPVLTPSVTPRPVGTPYVNAEGAVPLAFGAGFGRAIQDAADVTSQYVVQAKGRADASAVLDAETAVANKFRPLLHDPEKGYLALTGRDAFAAREATHKGLQDAIDEAGKGLTGDQAAAFKARIQSRLEQAQLLVERHASDGLRSAVVSSAQGAYKSALDNVSADPGALKSEFTAMLGPLAMLARNTGKDVATVQEDFQRDAAEAALRTLKARSDTEGANALIAAHPFLAPHKPEIDRIGIDKQAEARAQAALPTVLKRSGEVDNALVQKAVDAIDPGPLRDAFRARLEHRAALAQRDWKDRAGEAAAKVFDLGQTATGRFDWNLVPDQERTKLERLDLAQADKFKRRSVIDARIEQGIATREEVAQRRKDQTEAWVTANSLITDDYETVARMKPEEFKAAFGMGQMTATQFKGVQDRYLLIQKNVGRVPDENVIADEARRALQLGPGRVSAMSPEKQKKVADLQKALQPEITDYAIRHKGAPMPRDELRKLVADWVAEVVVPNTGIIRDDRVPRFQAPRPVARPTKTLNGETREWNGKAWVPVGAP